MAVFIQYDHLVQVVALAHIKIIGIVGRRDLYEAGAKLTVYMLIGENLHFAVYQRYYHLFTKQRLFLIILRRDGHATVAKQCFRAGGRNNNRVIRIFKPITDMIQLPIDLLVVYFVIGQRRSGSRIPVYNALPLVD